MKTDDNLRAAFAGESQANRRYLAFAKRAEQDGFPQVARLFRAAAAAETVHALAHLRALGAVRSTAENLGEAIDGEQHEYTKMYPEFIAIAEAEQHKRGVVTMKNAMAVEQVHHDLYVKAHSAVAGGRDLVAAKVWVCDVCGNTFVGEHPDVCPVCGVPHTKFTEIE